LGGAWGSPPPRTAPAPVSATGRRPIQTPLLMF
jgi:hypothetical protein